MIEIVGIIGGALFAAGCIPMAWRTIIAGRDVGTPIETQWLLFLACGVYSWYLFSAFGAEHIAFWFLEVVCWGIALWYHYRPRTPKPRNPNWSSPEPKCPHGWTDWDLCPDCRR